VVNNLKGSVHDPVQVTPDTRDIIDQLQQFLGSSDTLSVPLDV